MKYLAIYRYILRTADCCLCMNDHCLHLLGNLFTHTAFATIIVTCSVKTVPFGTFDILRNTILKHEATAVFLCHVLVTLDLHCNEYYMLIISNPVIHLYLVTNASTLLA